MNGLAAPNLVPPSQEVNRRFNEAQGRFIAELSRPGNRWMTLAQHRGLAAAQGVIENLHAGRLDPQGAHIVVSG